MTILDGSLRIISNFAFLVFFVVNHLKFLAVLVAGAGSAAFASVVAAADWPQWRGPHRDSVWHELGVLKTFPKEGLKVRWRVPIGAGHSSPVVSGGRVFVTDSFTRVEAQAARTWERLHCFDEKSGQALWTFSYEIGSGSNQPIHPDNPPVPVATPCVDGDRIFNFGIIGDVACLDTRTGTAVWRKNVAKDYDVGESPNVTACPVIDGELLILVVSGKDSAGVVAFDKHTGREVWRALDRQERSFSSPIIISAGGQKQLIVWTPQGITSLDPASGKTWWREEIATRQDYAVATPVFDGERLLISGMMFQLERDKPAASLVWPQEKSLSARVLSHTSIPAVLGNHVYAGKLQGRFVCLDARTGKQVWETDQVTKLAHCATIQVTLTGDQSALLFTDQGNLIRAMLSPAGYQEISRTKIIEPTYLFAGRKLVWALPAFANGHVLIRNGEELICASLQETP